ncbi:beta-glucan synthesis-associated protein [Thraustotheca clavata]|uniref:Beta-glucan synthesis-associated protein n=1 Tax=Thraustotheca clavata TaxID=74557 RepID=A0A1V9ZVB1_9STRA|nr:beta-glucan synthesis-associated protein [Thraustotheca clavata]
MNDLRRVSLLTLLVLPGLSASDTSYDAKSGVKAWVDVDTPSSVQTVVTSRGETWDLVMSDEFNRAGRDFTAGKDHIWTAMELADGVNAALEYYSINMTSTTKDGDLGVMQIKTQQDDIAFTVYNMYKSPPGFQQSRMYYRSGMVQSWNKFCMQGGRIEVSVKQPGVVNQDSGNPDLATPKGRVSAGFYYPTWPGVWLMGNLGRALFTASTNRMWPWTYNTCDETSKNNQAISACNTNPGYGLNAGQGRGAPEIDILEGGGQEISSSIQIAPGMPSKFRVVPPGPSDAGACIYTQTCTTTGANLPGVPTSFSKSRGYDTWYQGLRYAPTRLCSPVGSQIQTAKAINASLSSGIMQNKCTLSTCPASFDVNGYLGLVDNKGSHYWGINDDGTCMPVINGYNGAYLCDPYNTDSRCAAPLWGGNANGNPIPSFNYQMDAISANYPIHLAAYSSYLRYQLEWYEQQSMVTGDDGYIRWMLEDNPIFEITADTLVNPPQDSANLNPKKIMIEEPMYMIFNTALSTSWGTKPPNPGQPCRGNGQDASINKICSAFPLYLRIDYIRVWQHGNMTVGCDPATHPTAGWIKGHQQNYEDANNPVVQVDGGASCNSNDDCTLPRSATGGVQVISGSCDQSNLGGRCVCLSPTVWGGPRCTTIRSTAGGNSISSSFGPNLWVILVISALAILATIAIFYARGRKRHISTIPNGEAEQATEPSNVMPAAMRNTMNEGNTARSDSIRNRRAA